MKLILASIAATATLAVSAPVWASCSIHNDTKWSFTVESGNTSNQSVGAHTTTSIAAGKIKGIDKKNNKTISGSCKDGDRLEVKDEDGIPVLTIK